MLGLRSCVKENLGVTPAGMLFATTIGLPNELFVTTDTGENPLSFVVKLKTAMSVLRPVSTSNH